MCPTGTPLRRTSCTSWRDTAAGATWTRARSTPTARGRSSWSPWGRATRCVAPGRRIMSASAARARPTAACSRSPRRRGRPAVPIFVLDTERDGRPVRLGPGVEATVIVDGAAGAKHGVMVRLRLEEGQGYVSTVPEGAEDTWYVIEGRGEVVDLATGRRQDRKSTRLNSSHGYISYS